MICRVSAEYVQPVWDNIGSMVIGRPLFDMTNGWEGEPPAGQQVIVISHRPKPDGWHPEASCHFVDDVAVAIAKAKELAGEQPGAASALPGSALRTMCSSLGRFCCQALTVRPWPDFRRMPSRRPEHESRTGGQQRGCMAQQLRRRNVSGT